MTTLPQTVTPRLPRSTGAAHLAPASSMPLAMGAPGAQGLTGSDIRRILRTHIWLIMLSVVVSATIGYFLNRYLENNYPRYEAVGLVAIEPNVAVSVHGNGGSMSDMFSLPVEQKTQAALLSSDALISEVLKDPNSAIRKTAWFRSFPTVQAAKEDFFENYSVSPLQETTLVEVAFTWSIPAECKTIVDEVVDKHLLLQRNAARESLSQRSILLNKLRTEYKMGAEDNTRQLRELGSRLSGNGNMSSSGIKEMELSAVVRAELDMENGVADAQSRLDFLKSDLDQGRDPPEVDRFVDQNIELQTISGELDKSVVDRQAMAEEMGEGSRQVKAMDQRLAMLQRRKEEREAEIRSRARVELQELLEQEVSQLRVKENNLVRSAESLKTELGEISNIQADYLIAQEKDRNYQEMLKSVDNQLEDITNLSSSSPIRIVWNDPNKSTTPDQLKFPKIWITMGITISLGLALSLGIAFFREVADQTIRSPRDITRIGQMNLLGAVSDEADDPQAAGARLPLMIFDAPHSMIAEQLRQARSRLQHAASLDTTRSIMVTSPGPGDGKTTIACNLAAGLALNGRRILLVDANFRRPEIHRIFGVANERGFSDVLSGSLAFDQTIQETQVPNLSIMTSGAQPINATEMFESQLLVDFIERALEEFDHVIFDSGPMMIVAEAPAMAPRVDGVISVVRARGNSRGLLTRMRDGLRQSKAEHLGVILNAVRVQGGGYYGRNIKAYYEYQNG